MDAAARAPSLRSAAAPCVHSRLTSRRPIGPRRGGTHAISTPYPHGRRERDARTPLPGRGAASAPPLVAAALLLLAARGAPGAPVQHGDAVRRRRRRRAAAAGRCRRSGTRARTRARPANGSFNLHRHAVREHVRASARRLHGQAAADPVLAVRLSTPRRTTAASARTTCAGIWWLVNAFLDDGGRRQPGHWYMWQPDWAGTDDRRLLRHVRGDRAPDGGRARATWTGRAGRRGHGRPRLLVPARVGAADDAVRVRHHHRRHRLHAGGGRAAAGRGRHHRRPHGRLHRRPGVADAGRRPRRR